MTSVLHFSVRFTIQDRHTGNGLDLGGLQELPGSGNVEVGDTNVLDQTLVDELLHLGPGWGDIVG